MGVATRPGECSGAEHRDLRRRLTVVGASASDSGPSPSPGPSSTRMLGLATFPKGIFSGEAAVSPRMDRSWWAAARPRSVRAPGCARGAGPGGGNGGPRRPPGWDDLSFASDVSADGTIVVGESHSGSGRGVRWTPEDRHDRYGGPARRALPELGASGLRRRVGDRRIRYGGAGSQAAASGPEREAWNPRRSARRRGQPALDVPPTVPAWWGRGRRRRATRHSSGTPSAACATCAPSSSRATAGPHGMDPVRRDGRLGARSRDRWHRHQSRRSPR